MSIVVIVLLIFGWFTGVAITGYLWGMFTTLAHNDHCKHRPHPNSKGE